MSFKTDGTGTAPASETIVDAVRRILATRYADRGVQAAAMARLINTQASDEEKLSVISLLLRFNGLPLDPSLEPNTESLTPPEGDEKDSYFGRMGEVLEELPEFSADRSEEGSRQFVAFVLNAFAKFGEISEFAQAMLMLAVLRAQKFPLSGAPECPSASLDELHASLSRNPEAFASVRELLFAETPAHDVLQFIATQGYDAQLTTALCSMVLRRDVQAMHDRYCPCSSFDGDGVIGMVLSSILSGSMGGFGSGITVIEL